MTNNTNETHTKQQDTPKKEVAMHVCACGGKCKNGGKCLCKQNPSHAHACSCKTRE